MSGRKEADGRAGYTGGFGEDRYLDTDTPAVDTLYQIMTGLTASKILTAAHKMKIFDSLKEEGDPCTAEKLAKKHGYHKGATERILQTLTSMNLLKVRKGEQGSTYSNSAAGDLLVTNNPNTLKEMATWMDFFNRGLDDIRDVIKNGPQQSCHSGEEKDSGHATKCQHGHDHCHDKGACDDCGKKNVEGMIKCQHGNFHGTDGTVYDESGTLVHGHSSEGDPGESNDWDSEDTYRGMHNLLGSCSAKLMTAIDLSSHKSAVDLGGGSGILCFELKRQYPNMDVTLFELEDIIKLFEKHFLPGNEHLEVKTMAGNWDETPLPESELYILSQIVHDIPNAEELLRKIYAVLKPGGGILLLEHMLADDKVSLLAPALWDMVMLTHGGTLRSPSEFRALLTAIGFTDVTTVRTQEHNEYDIIYAKKPDHTPVKKTKK